MPIFGQVWLWSLASFVVGGLLTGVLLVRPARRRVAYLERTVEQLRADEYDWESDPDSIDGQDELLEFDEQADRRGRTAPRTEYLKSAHEALDGRRDRFPDDFFDDPEPESAPAPAPAPQASPGETTVLGPVRGDLESPPELPQPRINPAVTSRADEPKRPNQGSTVISRGRIQPVGPPKTGVDWFDPDYDPNAPTTSQRPPAPDQRPAPLEQRRPVPEQPRPPAPVEQRPVPVEPRPVPVEPMPARSTEEPPASRRGELGVEPAPPVPASSGLSGRLDGEKSESMNGVLTPPAKEEAPEPPKPAARPVPTQPEPSRPMTAARQQPAPQRAPRDEEQTQIIPAITDETPAPEPAAPAKPGGGATRTSTAPRRVEEAPEESRGNGTTVQVESRPASNGRAEAQSAGAPAVAAPTPSEGRALFEPMVPPPAEDTSSTGRMDGSTGQPDGQFTAPGPFGPGSAMPNPGGGSPSPEFTVKASVTALRYCTEDNPEFNRIVAEVWFKSTADAERVGFRPLT
jgi:hypothetical protein